MEDLKKPAIALCNEAFASDARSAASSKGVPGLRVVPESVPCESTNMEEIEAGVTAALDDVLAALTRALTPDEAAPKTKEVEKLPRITFKGALGEVNQFFYKRGWTDGLPIIPPTEHAVAEMLTGTDLPPDHIVAKIIPRMGKATVEKIAINAVMAGALPTYMPVLIAGVQALMEPSARFGTYEVSTGSWTPCWIINGPIRKDLNVNCGAGVLSPGNIANAAMGRAMGLIIKNIGGARKGIEDMGVLGNPGKYSTVMGENEEETPWEPLHVERGLKKEDSTVTVFFPNSMTQLNAYNTDAGGILGSVGYNILRRGLTCLMLIPAHAKILASRGYTKQDVKKFISENARAPFRRHPEYWGAFSSGSAPKYLPLDPQAPMRILRSLDQIGIVVTGGTGNFVGILRGGASESGGQSTGFSTKQVQLPSHWNKLVEKYKGIAPPESSE
jgi:hypothetical protein